MVTYEYTKNKKKSRGDEPILYYCKEDADIKPGAVFGPVIISDNVKINAKQLITKDL